MKREYTDEVGRTMMEGLLGILGVALILWFGIWGVQRLWYQKKASETVSELDERATFLSQSIMASRDQRVSTGELNHPTRHGYGVQIRPYGDQDYMFDVSDIPEQICKRILKTGWNLSYKTYLVLSDQQVIEKTEEQSPEALCTYEKLPDTIRFVVEGKRLDLSQDKKNK